ncbi:hypothetical protein ACQY0O_006845 [Thecaphora frezii]
MRCSVRCLTKERVQGAQVSNGDAGIAWLFVIATHSLSLSLFLSLFSSSLSQEKTHHTSAEAEWLWLGAKPRCAPYQFRLRGRVRRITEGIVVVAIFTASTDSRRKNRVQDAFLSLGREWRQSVVGM